MSKQTLMGILQSLWYEIILLQNNDETMVGEGYLATLGVSRLVLGRHLDN